MSTQTTNPEVGGNELDTMTAKGQRYQVNCMPLAYVREYMEDGSRKFITAEDGNISPVLLNFVSPDGKADGGAEAEEFLKKWVPRLLEYQGRPASLELLFEHKWDIGDLNTFLKRALGITAI